MVSENDEHNPVVFWGGLLICAFLIIQITSCGIMDDMEKRIMALEQDSHSHED